MLDLSPGMLIINVAVSELPFESVWSTSWGCLNSERNHIYKIPTTVPGSFICPPHSSHILAADDQYILIFLKTDDATNPSSPGHTLFNLFCRANRLALSYLYSLAWPSHMKKTWNFQNRAKIKVTCRLGPNTGLSLNPWQPCSKSKDRWRSHSLISQLTSP